MGNYCVDDRKSKRKKEENETRAAEEKQRIDEITEAWDKGRLALLSGDEGEAGTWLRECRTRGFDAISWKENWDRFHGIEGGGTFDNILTAMHYMERYTMTTKDEEDYMFYKVEDEWFEKYKNDCWYLVQAQNKISQVIAFASDKTILAVNGISRETKKEDLRTHFRQFGKIINIYTSNVDEGFAFVKYRNQKSLESVIREWNEEGPMNIRGLGDHITVDRGLNCSKLRQLHGGGQDDDGYSFFGEVARMVRLHNTILDSTWSFEAISLALRIRRKLVDAFMNRWKLLDDEIKAVAQAFTAAHQQVRKKTKSWRPEPRATPRGSRKIKGKELTRRRREKTMELMQEPLHRACEQFSGIESELLDRKGDWTGMFPGNDEQKERQKEFAKHYIRKINKHLKNICGNAEISVAFETKAKDIAWTPKASEKFDSYATLTKSKRKRRKTDAQKRWQRVAMARHVTGSLHTTTRAKPLNRFRRAARKAVTLSTAVKPPVRRAPRAPDPEIKKDAELEVATGTGKYNMFMASKPAEEADGALDAVSDNTSTGMYSMFMSNSDRSTETDGTNRPAGESTRTSSDRWQTLRAKFRRSEKTTTGLAGAVTSVLRRKRRGKKRRSSASSQRRRSSTSSSSSGKGKKKKKNKGKKDKGNASNKKKLQPAPDGRAQRAKEKTAQRRALKTRPSMTRQKSIHRIKKLMAIARRGSIVSDASTGMASVVTAATASEAE